MYSLNPDSAKKAGASTRIDATGPYVGTIKAAWAIRSSNGTDGVEMMFHDQNGQTADYLQVWTRKSDGKELMGMHVINALMACCELRELTVAKQSITRGEETKQVDMLRELVNKRVGLMLEREPYIKNGGGEGFRMVIVAPFEADTRRTAKEKLERKDKAEAYPALVARLKDRPLQTQKGNTQTQAAPATSSAGFEDDDLPF